MMSRPDPHQTGPEKIRERMLLPLVRNNPTASRGVVGVMGNQAENSSHNKLVIDELKDSALEQIQDLLEGTDRSSGKRRNKVRRFHAGKTHEVKTHPKRTRSTGSITFTGGEILVSSNMHTVHKKDNPVYGFGFVQGENDAQNGFSFRPRSGNYVHRLGYGDGKRGSSFGSRLQPKISDERTGRSDTEEVIRSADKIKPTEVTSDELIAFMNNPDQGGSLVRTICSQHSQPPAVLAIAIFDALPRSFRDAIIDQQWNCPHDFATQVDEVIQRQNSQYEGIPAEVQPREKDEEEIAKILGGILPMIPDLLVAAKQAMVAYFAKRALIHHLRTKNDSLPDGEKTLITYLEALSQGQPIAVIAQQVMRSLPSWWSQLLHPADIAPLLPIVHSAAIRKRYEVSRGLLDAVCLKNIGCVPGVRGALENIFTFSKLDVDDVVGGAAEYAYGNILVGGLDGLRSIIQGNMRASPDLRDLSDGAALHPHDRLSAHAQLQWSRAADLALNGKRVNDPGSADGCTDIKIERNGNDTHVITVPKELCASVYNADDVLQTLLRQSMNLNGVENGGQPTCTNEDQCYTIHLPTRESGRVTFFLDLLLHRVRVANNSR